LKFNTENGNEHKKNQKMYLLNIEYIFYNLKKSWNEVINIKL